MDHMSQKLIEPFEVEHCKGSIIFHNRNDVTVQGYIDNSVTGGTITYKAAAPMDRLSSFSGSGLPFANYQQAFENTPNRGKIELAENNFFSIDMLMPNSYYVGLGTVLVCPTLFISYHDGEKNLVISIKVNNPTPYRLLTYPMSNSHASRQNNLFYSGMKELPVRTQEQILRDGGYPETFNEKPKHQTLPVNFWGARPPV